MPLLSRTLGAGSYSKRALFILDWFHIMSHLNKAIDEVRWQVRPEALADFPTDIIKLAQDILSGKHEVAQETMDRVANRPGRIEPRRIKRDRQHYPMMHDPRRELRKRGCMT